MPAALPGGTLLSNMLLSLVRTAWRKQRSSSLEAPRPTAARSHSLRLSFIENPDYAVTNTIHSSGWRGIT